MRKTYVAVGGKWVPREEVGQDRKPLAVKPTVHNLRSSALPKGWAYASEYDDSGRPVFRSKRHIDECMAKARDHGEPVFYDD